MKRLRDKLSVSAILLAALIIPGSLTAVGRSSAGISPRDHPGTPARAASTGHAAATGQFSEVVLATEPAVSSAITRLEAGELDAYASTISDPDIAQQIEDSPTLQGNRTYGSYNELTFNPSGPVFAGTGKLNPFAVPRIREAMNWLVDREHIAQEIMGGMAVPRWHALNSASRDYAELADVARALELDYVYNKDLASQVIAHEMEALGATMENGLWQYGGEPVEIILLIRTEDARLDIGDYVGDQLEDIGFMVTRDYRTAAEASPIWIGSDPAEGLFHIYTGGWITTMVPRDLAGNFAFFYTDMGLAFPLWQAYENTPEFYELAERLDRGDFADMAERYEMMTQALEWALEDSVRVFLVDNQGITPRRADVSYASDLYGGLAGSWMWAHTLQRDDSPDAAFAIGTPSILSVPWNPLDGSNWVYDMMPIRATGEMGHMPDPYTGLWWPNRFADAVVVAQDGLPIFKTHDWVDLQFEASIEVPDDAWVDWDPVEQRFLTAGEVYTETQTARRKSTVHYPPDLYTSVTWHDGSPFSIADVVLNMILSFDRAQQESPVYDESKVPAYDAFKSRFRGMRIVSEDPLIIEHYSDSFALDAELSVTTWFPYYSRGPGAWHNLALGLLAEEAGQAAFSEDKAGAEEVPWLNYIAEPTLDVLADQLAAAHADDYIPYAAILEAYVTPAEAAQRWDNLDQWYSDRGHFWLGTGPLYLEQVAAAMDELVLKPYFAHPDPPDRWDGFTEARVAELDIAGPTSVLRGEPAIFDVEVTFQGDPCPMDDIEMLSYMVIDGQGTRSVAAEADAVEDGLWRITLTGDETGQLQPRINRLEVIAVSELVVVPTFSTHLFEIPYDADAVVLETEPSFTEAIARIEADELDLYAHGISAPDIYAAIEAADNVDGIFNYGSYNELTFNPAGPIFDGTGKLNPFSVRRVREAMNYLIDRDYIGEEIHGGLGIPRWHAFNNVSADYARMAEAARALELEYAYDLAQAAEIIGEEMEALGATMENGLWQYGGEPVEIILLIRTEDARLDIGDYVGDQLEAIGFTVIRDYKTAAEASPIWLSGNPEDGLYHIYTGGWITTVVPRNLAGNFAFFYTDMGLAFPLWQAYENTPEFYELVERLDRGDFADMDERYEMMAQAMEWALEDSHRVWINDNAGITPKRPEVAVTADLYGGVSGAWLWAPTLTREGELDGPMHVAMPTILPEPWNPLGGTNWVYDMMAIRGTAEMGYVPDPYTGLWWPRRFEHAEVVVEAGLPVFQTLDWVDLAFADEIVVPDDAWADWDAEEQRFLTAGEVYTVPETVARKSTVTYPNDLFDTVTWHDGSPLSVGDFLMAMIMSFDRAQEESAVFDPAAVTAFESFMADFRGVRIVSEDPLTIETYSNSFQLDAENSVTGWYPYYSRGPGAWHNLALGLLAEEAGQAAFSEDKAGTGEIPWLNYIAEPTLDVLADQLAAAQSDDYIPYAAILEDYVTPAEAAQRWDNLDQWYSDRGHFWLGTGPLYLEQVAAAMDELVLKPYLDHPDDPDRWTDFIEPPVPDVSLDGPETFERGEEVVYSVEVTLDGEPHPHAHIEAVRYLVVDSNRNVSLSGDATPTATDGLWQVTLDAQMTETLLPGPSQLEIIVVSKQIVIPGFAHLEVSVTGECHWADVNCDGKVDIEDVQMVASAWRCAEGDGCYDPRLDVDNDGIITVIDIMLVASEWGWPDS